MNLEARIKDARNARLGQRRGDGRGVRGVDDVLADFCLLNKVWSSKMEVVDGVAVQTMSSSKTRTVSMTSSSLRAPATKSKFMDDSWASSSNSAGVAGVTRDSESYSYRPPSPDCSFRMSSGTLGRIASR